MSEFECPICFSSQYYLRSYHDQHNFCPQCLEILRGSELPCPICRLVVASQYSRTVETQSLSSDSDSESESGLEPLPQITSPQNCYVEVRSNIADVEIIASIRRLSDHSLICGFVTFPPFTEMVVYIGRDGPDYLLNLTAGLITSVCGEPLDPLVHQFEIAQFMSDVRQYVDSYSTEVLSFMNFNPALQTTVISNPFVESQINGDQGSTTNKDDTKEPDGVDFMISCHSKASNCLINYHFHPKDIDNKILKGAARRVMTKKNKASRKNLIEKILKNFTMCTGGCDDSELHYHLQNICFPTTLPSFISSMEKGNTRTAFAAKRGEQVSDEDMVMDLFNYTHSTPTIVKFNEIDSEDGSKSIEVKNNKQPSLKVDIETDVSDISDDESEQSSCFESITDLPPTRVITRRIDTEDYCIRVEPNDDEIETLLDSILDKHADKIIDDCIEEIANKVDTYKKENKNKETKYQNKVISEINSMFVNTVPVTVYFTQNVETRTIFETIRQDGAGSVFKNAFMSTLHGVATYLGSDSMPYEPRLGILESAVSRHWVTNSTIKFPSKLGWNAYAVVEVDVECAYEIIGKLSSMWAKSNSKITLGRVQHGVYEYYDKEKTIQFSQEWERIRNNNVLFIYNYLCVKQVLLESVMVKSN